MVFVKIGERHVDVRHTKDAGDSVYEMRDVENPAVFGQGQTVASAKRRYLQSAALHHLDLTIPGVQP